MSTSEPLRSFASLPPEAPSEVTVEYDSRGRRESKTFDDPNEARQFYGAKFRAGKRPASWPDPDQPAAGGDRRRLAGCPARPK